MKTLEQQGTETLLNGLCHVALSRLDNGAHSESHYRKVAKIEQELVNIVGRKEFEQMLFLLPTDAKELLELTNEVIEHIETSYN